MASDQWPVVSEQGSSVSTVCPGAAVNSQAPMGNSVIDIYTKTGSAWFYEYVTELYIYKEILGGGLRVSPMRGTAVLTEMPCSLTTGH